MRGTAKIVTQADTAAVAAGRSIYPEDTLRFASADGLIVALCPDAGRVVVSPDPETFRAASQAAPPSEPPLLLAMMRQAIARPSAPTPLSTRGPLPGHPIDGLGDLADVHQHFGVARYLVIDSIAVRLDKTGPLAEALARGASFSLLVATEDEPEGYPVPFHVQEDYLYVPAEALHALPTSSKEHPLAAALLFKARAEQAEGEWVTAVRLVRPPPGQVQRELGVLVETMRRHRASEEATRREAAAFLQATYGAPYLPQLPHLRGHAHD